MRINAGQPASYGFLTFFFSSKRPSWVRRKFFLTNIEKCEAGLQTSRSVPAHLFLLLMCFANKRMECALTVLRDLKLFFKLFQSFF